jgi:hypothetical protein
MPGAEAAISRLIDIGRADLAPRAWFMFGCRLVSGGNLKDGDGLALKFGERADLPWLIERGPCESGSMRPVGKL